MAVNTTVQVTMPAMGESVTEGTVLEWNKQEGDQVDLDEVLVEIGHRLDQCLRASDEIGRVGGDRFGIGLAQCAGSQVASAADSHTGRFLAEVLAADRTVPARKAG